MNEELIQITVNEVLGIMECLDQQVKSIAGKPNAELILQGKSERAGTVATLLNKLGQSFDSLEIIMGIVEYLHELSSLLQFESGVKCTITIEPNMVQKRPVH